MRITLRLHLSTLQPSHAAIGVLILSRTVAGVPMMDPKSTRHPSFASAELTPTPWQRHPSFQTGPRSKRNSVEIFDRFLRGKPSGLSMQLLSTTVNNSVDLIAIDISCTAIRSQFR